MRARKIKIKTKHGGVETPFFMPDATRGVIKGVSAKEIKKAGIKVICVNTYHLYLSPGLEVIKNAGGIHKFMNWNGPILSDSGGFQVFSLIHRNKDMGQILKDKVIFKSPINGVKHELTPEKSIQIQFDLGVDMMVVLDDCPLNSASRVDVEHAVNHTIDWAKRSKQEFETQIKKRKLKSIDQPLLFGVIQGGKYLDLRERCAKELIKIGFDGYGFGGMPVDMNGKLMSNVLEFTANIVPSNKLRFALGIGKPDDIITCHSFGWDMFDCVIPTREARHGRLYTCLNKNNFIFNILNSKYKNNFFAINKDSIFKELKTYSKSYLHHLFKVKDILGLRLATLNNLEFYAVLAKRLSKIN